MGIIDLFVNGPKKDKNYKIGDWVKIKPWDVDACIVDITGDIFILEWEENGMMKTEGFDRSEIE